MARALLTITAIDDEGDKLPATAVTFTNSSGGSFGQPLYAAASGGSPAVTHLTDSQGMLLRYVDTPTRALATVAGTTPRAVQFDPDPADIMYLTEPNLLRRTQPVALDLYGAATETFPLTVQNAYRGVRGIAVLAGGSGYSTPPAVGISGGGGAGATATCTIDTSTVTAVVVTAGGTGYTTPPAVAITGGGGSGAAAAVIMAFGGVQSVYMTNPGSGYTSTPSVSFSGGGGSGAAAVAQRGSVTTVTVTNPGNGYTTGPNITFTGGGGSGAAARPDVGDPHFVVKDRSGVLPILEVGHLGAGAYAGDEITWTRHFIASNIRNWVPFNGVTFAFTNMAVGSVGPYVSFVSSYQASSQPLDGMNGSVLIPDDSCGSFVTFVLNTAAGGGQNADGGFRATEHELIIYPGTTPHRDSQGIQVGVHTAVAKITAMDRDLLGSTPVVTPYGDCSVLALSLDQTGLAGWGTTPQMANAAFLAGGSPGHRWAFGALNNANGTVWGVHGQTGQMYTRNAVPMATNTYTLGNVSTIYAQVWSNLFAAASGAEGTPSVGFPPAYNTGLFAIASGIGITVNATEQMRITSGGLLSFRNPGGNQNFALGGGATATMGTIGGSGPTLASQVNWLKIDVSGATRYIPLWQ